VTEIAQSYTNGLPYNDKSRLLIDTNLIGYWGFDEAGLADDVYDESIGGNHLSVFNSSAVVPGRVGNGRQFNGVDTSSYISMLPLLGKNIFVLLIITVVCIYRNLMYILTVN
jgi:hypothetical protein